MKPIRVGLLGIGTVLTPDDLALAAGIGAAFAISPGMSRELLQAAAAGDLPFVPGIQTASDLIACVTHGFELVKFFPAVPGGGLAMIDALGGPFPTVRFCPTGGIGEANVTQWLAHPKVVAVGGSWIAPEATVRSTHRFWNHPLNNSYGVGLGFRCAQQAPQQIEQQIRQASIEALVLMGKEQFEEARHSVARGLRIDPVNPELLDLDRLINKSLKRG